MATTDTEQTFEAIARSYLTDTYKPGAMVALAIPNADRSKFYYYEFQKRRKEWVVTDKDVWKLPKE